MPNRLKGDWWDKSWSIVTGCNWPEGERPEGCRNCWAGPYTKTRPGVRGAHKGKPFEKVLVHPDRLDQPLKRTKPTTWLVSILGDLFHPNVPRGFITEAIHVMVDECSGEPRPDHRFVILTKRYEAAAKFFRELPTSDLMLGEILNWCNAEVLHRNPVYQVLPRNPVYLMFSAWDQASVDAACAAAVKLPPGLKWGLHLEPLLGSVDLSRWMSSAAITCRCGHTFEAATADWCKHRVLQDTGSFVAERLEWTEGTLACPKCNACVCDRKERWRREGKTQPGAGRFNWQHKGYEWKPLPSWIVVGGETGPKARPMRPDWVRTIRDQCAAAGIPFWLKSWGEWAEWYKQPGADAPMWSTESKALHRRKYQYVTQGGMRDAVARYGSVRMARVGKPQAGRLLDGKEHNAVPWEVAP